MGRPEHDLEVYMAECEQADRAAEWAVEEVYKRLDTDGDISVESEEVELQTDGAFVTLKVWVPFPEPDEPEYERE